MMHIEWRDIMLVKKILNNNALLALDDKTEVIILGKGVSYGVKPFDEIADKKEYQKFIPESESTITKFNEMMNDIPIQHITIAQKIINYAEKELNTHFTDLLLFNLTEHIDYSIERIKKGITLKNVLLPEIKKFYQNEYNIAYESLKLIYKEIGFSLPEDEAGFIAIHLVNANENNEDMDFTLAVTELTGIVINAIEQVYKKQISMESHRYSRLITHIRYFARRLLDSELSNEDDEYTYQQISNRYPLATQVSDIISKEIKKEYDMELSLDEKLYFLLHIAKLYE